MNSSIHPTLFNASAVFSADRDPTRERPTTSSGDPLDGTGEDNHVEKQAPKDRSPQQEHNDEDHG